MGEGVRLKNENLSQNLIHQQSNHPQHPQQTIHTEKLLKETEDNNNIDYTRVVLFPRFGTNHWKT